MTYLTDHYVNFFTDYGFKRLFGEEPHKDLLRDFLNALLHDEQGEIVDLTYLKDEQLGRTPVDRKAIFDLYCENERGEKFIVELQKAKQNFFKDRSVFYSTFPIQQQAKRGDWDFRLNAVYTIGILDFVFDEDKQDNDKYRYDIKLQDIDTNEVFYEKLTFIYLEMPKFNKGLDQLETHVDKWLYAIKHLDRLDHVPDALRERVFERFFEVARIANFSREELQSYEDSLKYYRDLKNSFDTAREDGRKEGREEGRKEAVLSMARGLLDLLDDDTIAQKTGLDSATIAALRKESQG
ncbi:PD-(D/E)XK nuclease family transposase [Thiorhodovibrio winogradskyi]|uniref:PD-(D/E)XK nuclease family transposase n=1 Tax=Thiorhodovibrio winogradskyi TaxID=77007 RepID=A0ABZ0SGY6_9GAMM|nr:Rpn family recombination-promoting nuclease/putative transposase [Thiorhodovibrio winogradskyi]